MVVNSVDLIVSSYGLCFSLFFVNLLVFCCFGWFCLRFSVVLYVWADWYLAYMSCFMEFLIWVVYNGVCGLLVLLWFSFYLVGSMFGFGI